MKRDFSKTALHSKLFKGRSDWYFCYLKTEKIASVCNLLLTRAAPASVEPLKDIARTAGQIVEEVVYAAAGEISEEALLANFFSMLSSLRLRAGEGHLSKETTKVLIEEYEGVVERVVGESRHLGVTLSSHDLAVPVVVEEPLFTPLPPLLAPLAALKDIKDIDKGHAPTLENREERSIGKGQQRTALILDFVQKNKGVSVRDIARVIRDCSEKTIQRELNIMIEQGVVTRQGERRWSTYHAA